MNALPIDDPDLWLAFRATVARDLRLAFRRLGDLGTPLVFFGIVCTLFPLALGPSPELLKTLGPGVIWVAVLMAQLLSADTVFRTDFDDGTLEQWIMSGHPTTAIVFAKIMTHWMVTGMPLVLVSPLLAETYRLPLTAVPVLIVSLALGSVVLAMLGALGSALTLGARQSSALISLLILPLAMPILIFGARAVSLAVAGGSASSALYLLAALAVLSVTLVPFAAALAIRISID